MEFAFRHFYRSGYNSCCKAYLKRVKDGLQEADRPACCEGCASQRRPHRHGQFERTIYTRTALLFIPVFRFRCPDCGGNWSVQPDLVETASPNLLLMHEDGTKAQFEASAKPRKRLPLTELNELFLWEEQRTANKTCCIQLA